MNSANNLDSGVPDLPPGRAFDDSMSARTNVYDSVKQAAQAIKPLEWRGKRIELSDVDYDPTDDDSEDSEKYNYTAQANAVRERTTLGRRLRGTLRMVDTNTGEVLDEARKLIAVVPRVNEDSTIIYRGSRYSLVNQQRLKSGAYGRIKNNGELETYVNPLNHSGSMHRYDFTPENKIFTLNVRNSHVPLVPLLRILGVKDQQIREAWGDEIAEANFTKKDQGSLDKLYTRLVSKKEQLPQATPEYKQMAIRKAIEDIRLDPWANKKTLGILSDRLTPELILKSTAKALQMSRGESDGDDRDHLGFQTIHSIEDLFAERLQKDSGRHQQQAFRKAMFRNKLAAIPTKFLQGQLEATIFGSGLGIQPEYSNPLNAWANASRLTKMGEGAIGDAHSVPQESRNYHVSHQGFIDPALTAECAPGYVEVMTDEGWYRLDELQPHHKLACLIAGRVAYHQPEKLHSYDFNGHLYGYKGKLVAYEVTPNHRMWTAPEHNGAAYRFETAAEIENKTRMVMCGGHAPYIGKLDNLQKIASPIKVDAGHQAFKLPEMFAIEDWAEFLGWFLSEGSTGGDSSRGGRYSVGISQSKSASPKSYERIHALLTRMGLRFSANKNGFQISGTHLASYCHYFGRSHEKYLPEEVFEYPVEARRRLLEVLMLGDGTHYKGKPDDKRIYSTASLALAEDIQALAFGLGYSVGYSRAVDDRKDSYHDSHKVILHVRTRRKIGRCKVPEGGFYRRPYIGKVYCATVPGGLMYWRVPGYSGFWIGNSLKVGVDLNLAGSVRKGKNGELYTPLVNARTGKTEYLTPEQALEHVVAFQGADSEIPGYIVANYRGSEDYAKPDEVDYILPNASDSMFSGVSNLIPMRGAQPQNRTSMSARFLQQSVPLVNREAPLVTAAVPGTGEQVSYYDLYADKVGLQRARDKGRVVDVKPDRIVLETPQGLKTTWLHVDTPLGAKTAIKNTPVVKIGDVVEPGQPLATSNYTDQKGSLALGVNARMALMPWGDNYEDAYTISESFAKRMGSEHSYNFRRELHDGMQVEKNAFMSVMPRVYTKAQLDNFDDDGLIRLGTKVRTGDPLALALGKKSPNLSKQVSKTGAVNYTDESQTWDHEDDGVVTSVHRSKNGNAVVTVAAISPLKSADKLCYSADTEVLTSEGWVFVDELTTGHKIATLVDGHVFKYLKPLKINAYTHTGRMYSLETTQVSLLVTDNHKLYASSHRKRPLKGAVRASQFDCTGFGLIEAQKLFGKRYRLKRDGVWTGGTQREVVFEAETYDCGERTLTSGKHRSLRKANKKSMSIMDYAMLLGAYLAEGSIVDHSASGTYGAHISQVKPHGKQEFEARWAKNANKHWKLCPVQSGYRIYAKQLFQHFGEFAGKDAYTKRIPNYVFDWPVEAQRELLDWMIWGDGSRAGINKGRPLAYFTSSRGLADDVQRLLLHVGWSGNIKVRPGYSHCIKGRYTECRESYVVSIFTQKQFPTINHHLNNKKKQKSQHESWAEYDGVVYCPSMPVGHVIYVRRNGKPVWCGNSELYGTKGIVKIIPDDEMLQDEEGKPFDIVSSELGLISRKNSSRVFSLSLGKIAQKTGKPYILEEMAPGRDLDKFVDDELKKHNMSATETVVDPVSGRKIPGVYTGQQYILKLIHMAEGKAHGRGVGMYSSDDTPAKGSEEGMQAKRLSNQELGALVAHGAFEYLRDAALINGQRNDEYWARYVNGHDLPSLKVPFVYDKFVGYLKGMGLNPIKDGHKTRLMLLTDKDTKEQAGDREVTTGETVDLARDMKPIAGGLFDPKNFGERGDKFASYKLALPIPHPLLEDTFRNLMGVTKQTYRDIMSGKEKFGHYGTGVEAISKWLENLDAPKEYQAAKRQAQDARKTKREQAVKKLRYLRGIVDRGIDPKSLLIEHVPIIPPAYRPISKLAGKDTPLIDGMNLLYRDMIAADKNYRKISQFSDDTSNERLAVYDAVHTAVGLRMPDDPELQRKNVSGIMQKLVGNSPKTSFVSRKLLSGTMDHVGRAVASPSTKLDMDQIGIPEEQAWSIYKYPLMRRLAQRGMDLTQASEAIQKRLPVAREALEAEMAYRPVIATRAPVLHKYGVSAFMPKLVEGTTLQMNPFINAGYNLDFDGNCVDHDEIIYLGIDKSEMLKYAEGVEWFSTLLESTNMRLLATETIALNGILKLAVRIGELPQIGKKIKNTKKQTVYELPPGITIETYDITSGQVKWSPVTAFTVDRSHRVIDVTYSNSIKVSVSDNESLAILDLQSLEIKRRKPEESIGAFTPVIRRSPLTVEAGEASYEDGWFLAAMLANGWKDTRQVGYAKCDQKMIDEVERYCRTLTQNFVAYRYEEEKTDKKFAASQKIHMNGPTLPQLVPNLVHEHKAFYGQEGATWLEPRTGPKPWSEFGGRGALFKYVDPVATTNFGREAWIGFLCGYLENDGSLFCKQRSEKPGKYQDIVRINTSSPYLLEDLKCILRKLGIRYCFAFKRATNAAHPGYILDLSVCDLYPIRNELKFVSESANAWLTKFQSRGVPADRRDMVPVPALLCSIVMSEKAFVHQRQNFAITGWLTREKAKSLLVYAKQQLGKNDIVDRWEQIVENTDVIWSKVEHFEPRKGVHTVYDLEIPETKVFAINSGLIVYDTMNFHAVISDKAVREAKEKLLPSKMLISPKDFKTPMFVPRQDHALGLYLASTRRNDDKSERTFASLKDAIKAFKRGEIDAGTKVKILKGK